VTTKHKMSDLPSNPNLVTNSSTLSDMVLSNPSVTVVPNFDELKSFVDLVRLIPSSLSKEFLSSLDFSPYSEQQISYLLAQLLNPELTSDHLMNPHFDFLNPSCWIHAPPAHAVSTAPQFKEWVTATCSLDFTALPPLLVSTTLPVFAEHPAARKLALATSLNNILVKLALYLDSINPSPPLQPQAITFFRDAAAFTAAISKCAASLRILTESLERIFSFRVEAAQVVCDIVMLLYDVFVATTLNTLAQSLPSFIYRFFSLFKLPGLMLSTMLSWFGSLSQQDQTPHVPAPLIQPQGVTDFDPVTYFVGAIGTCLFGAYRPVSEVRSVLGLCSLRREFTGACESFTALLSWLSSFVPECAKHWIARWCPSKRLSELLCVGAPLRKIVEDVYYWDATAFRQRVSYSSDLQDHILKTHKEFLALMGGCVSSTTVSHLGPLLAKTMRVMDETVALVDVARFTSNSRKEPFSIVFAGNPGIGKSTIAPIIAQDMCPAEYLDNAVYTRNPSLRFWETYHGQHAMVYDDLGIFNTISSDGTGEFNEYMSAISS
jgi:hypothetical protein